MLAKISAKYMIEESPIVEFLRQFPIYLSLCLGSFAFGRESAYYKALKTRRDKFFKILNEMGQIICRGNLTTFNVDLSLVPFLRTAIPGHVVLPRRIDPYIKTSAVHVIWRHGNSNAIRWAHEAVLNGMVPHLFPFLVPFSQNVHHVLSKNAILSRQGSILSVSKDSKTLSEQIRYLLNESANGTVYSPIFGDKASFSSGMVRQLQKYEIWFEKLETFTPSEASFLFSFAQSHLRMFSKNAISPYEMFNYSLIPSLDDLHHFLCLRPNDLLYRHLRLWCTDLPLKLQKYWMLMGGTDITQILRDSMSAQIFLALLELNYNFETGRLSRYEEGYVAAIAASIYDKDWLSLLRPYTFYLRVDPSFSNISKEKKSGVLKQQPAKTAFAVAFENSHFDCVRFMLKETRNSYEDDEFESRFLSQFRDILLEEVDRRMHAHLPVRNNEYDKIIRFAIELSPRRTNPFWHFFQRGNK